MNENEPNLSEADFISEGKRKNRKSFWFWGILLTLALLLILLGQFWMGRAIRERKAEDPFLQVTNREISLFLWQFPEYMRINAKRKAGYLTGFQFLDRVTPEPELADQLVVAPPQLLFLYHTWHRLLKDQQPHHSIYPIEFKEFLKEDEQWQPDNWPNAPIDYVDLVNSLDSLPLTQDLQKEPLSTFPEEVRLAFQGWKNYFKEGDQINQVRPTYTELRSFLNEYPHYGRSFWKNILSNEYLKSIVREPNPDQIVPRDELAPFLRAALYNNKKKEKK